MTQRNHLRRRTLLKGMAATSLLPLLGANLVGCSDDSDNLGATVSGRFLHGVASGDPLTDRVILWTRLTPEAEGPVGVAWEVSESPDFDAVVASGEGTTSADVDYTVKVDVEGLAPERRYYYRFSSGGNMSSVGRTRTLPLGTVAAASFAVVSCSKFPTGFFNVYREVSQQDVDAVLHLGDYFYESGNARDGEALGRVVDPPREIFSLEDYRTRYAQYRRDEDLQAAHMAHPFITVWDDHEVANNTWRNGAENHQPDEGDFGARKMAAIQAWYEWQPVRPPSAVEDIIYRRFQYGDLLDLLMLDTRIIGRDRQLEYDDFSTGGMIDLAAARAAIGAADRSLLGDDQRAWLREQLSQSAARWQVLGQQVLLESFSSPGAYCRSAGTGRVGWRCARRRHRGRARRDSGQEQGAGRTHRRGAGAAGFRHSLQPGPVGRLRVRARPVAAPRRRRGLQSGCAGGGFTQCLEQPAHDARGRCRRGRVRLYQRDLQWVREHSRRGCGGAVHAPGGRPDRRSQARQPVKSRLPVCGVQPAAGAREPPLRHNDAIAGLHG
ncbi:MAG: alkaline phosphatase D family protein [Halioglobus sp.]|nr:alkaline phosphatase D family protein [Halioglobus sp.]